MLSNCSRLDKSSILFKYCAEKNVFLQKKEEVLEEDANEASDIGENEDQDVKTERQKVKNLMHSHNAHQPVVVVEVGI